MRPTVGKSWQFQAWQAGEPVWLRGLTYATRADSFGSTSKSRRAIFDSCWFRLYCNGETLSASVRRGA